MKSFHLILAFISIVLVFITTVTMIAQPTKALPYDSITEKSQVRIGLRYTSDYLYMGRSDSSKTPYLSPSISYYHKSGFFLHGALSYLTNREEGRIDMVTLSCGYDFYAKKVALGASVSEYFFSDFSYNVIAEMSTYLNAYAGYDFTLFTLYGDVSLGLSDGTDIFLGAEIDRTFYSLKNKLLIIPAVAMNAGTQHYYNAYYNYRSTQTGSWGGRAKGKGGMLSMPGTTQTSQVLESNKFNVLDYEAGLTITYKIQNIRLFTSSTWTFPVNPSTLTNDQGTYQEDLKNGFFWSSGIRILL